MKRTLITLCALSVAAGAFALGKDQTARPADRVVTPAAATENCKPSAPIQIELAPRDLIGGRARLDYTVTPIVDALAIEVSVGFPQGGTLRWHTEPSRAAAERGISRTGAISAELPTNLPGVELEVRAHISIPDPEAPDGIGVYTTTRTVTWGEVDRIVDNVTEVFVEGELSLETPATHY